MDKVKMKKRVGIDFHVVDGLFQGSKTYMLELFPRLFEIAHNYDFYLFLDDVEALRKTSPAFSLPNVHLIYMPHAGPIKRLCWQLPLLQRKYRLDLLHVQYVMPIPSFSPCMVSLHDILFESYPEYFTPSFRLRSRILMRLSAWRAAHVFTISEFSLKEIHEHYRVPLERLSLVHCAVNHNSYYPGNEGEQYVVDRGLKSKGYVLCVGRLEPRKNHINLFKAYAKIDTTVPLVIVGQRHFGYEKIFSLVSELGIEKRVIFIEDGSNDELPALYRHALLFVYPTWAEGFGMPPLEAMASGVPTISSGNTSIPEVVGKAGILIDPADVAEIALAIDSYLKSPEQRSQSILLGLEQAQVFDWHKSAVNVKNTYDKFFK